MPRRFQKTVNRWLMINVAGYSSIALVMLLVVAFSPASRNGETMEAQFNQKNTLGVATVGR